MLLFGIAQAEPIWAPARLLQGALGACVECSRTAFSEGVQCSRLAVASLGTDVALLCVQLSCGNSCLYGFHWIPACLTPARRHKARC